MDRDGAIARADSVRNSFKEVEILDTDVWFPGRLTSESHPHSRFDTVFAGGIVDNMEESTADLDPELLGRLPPELLEKVIAKLPFTILLTFRTVCRNWKDLTDTPKIAYEGASGEKYNLLAADGGLLWFSSDHTPDVFNVCNPLSKRWRALELPSPALPRLPRGSAFQDPFSNMLVGLYVNQETGTYKLLVAGIHEDGPRGTFLYRSASKSWKRCAGVPPMGLSLQDGEWMSERGICSSGNLYWHVYECCSSHLNVSGLLIIKALLKFDLEDEAWTVAQESLPTQRPCDFHIVAHDGQVLLLDWCDWGEDDYVPPSELTKLGPEVKQVIRDGLPVWLYDTTDDTYTQSKSFALGEIIYNIYDTCEPYTCTGSHRVAQYNSQTEVLTWLPDLPFIPNPSELCAFAPSLRTEV